jgi:hypothetical protein
MVSIFPHRGEVLEEVVTEGEVRVGVESRNASNSSEKSPIHSGNGQLIMTCIFNIPIPFKSKEFFLDP